MPPCIGGATLRSISRNKVRPDGGPLVGAGLPRGIAGRRQTVARSLKFVRGGLQIPGVRRMHLTVLASTASRILENLRPTLRFISRCRDEHDDHGNDDENDSGSGWREIREPESGGLKRVACTRHPE